MKKDKPRFKNVKTIIWDLDNTVWVHRKDEAIIIAETFGIEPAEKFEKQFRCMLEKFEEFFKKQKVTDEKIIELIERTMPILSTNGISVHEFLKRWFPIETSFLNEDAFDMIILLKYKGYKNIALSDWIWDAQIMLLEKYGVLPYMDEIYTCDDNYIKGNPKSSLRIIEPGKEKEYVIIGDSLKSDIAFANHAGIKSIWYNPTYKENITEFIPTVEVSSLLEIPKILL